MGLIPKSVTGRGAGGSVRHFSAAAVCSGSNAGAPLKDLLRSLLTLRLVSGLGPAVISTLVIAADAFPASIIDQAADGKGFVVRGRPGCDHSDLRRGGQQCDGSVHVPVYGKQDFTAVPGFDGTDDVQMLIDGFVRQGVFSFQACDALAGLNKEGF